MEAKSKGGRPEIPIDLDEFEKLAGLHCTNPDIAGWFGMATNTLEKKLLSKKKLDTKYGAITLRELQEIGKAKGCVSLRRRQYEAANGGNPTMLIWLGKQMLGQKDSERHSVELTGKDGDALFPVQALHAAIEKAQAEANGAAGDSQRD